MAAAASAGRARLQRRIVDNLLPAAVPVGVVLIWEMVLRMSDGGNILLPPPSRVFAALVELTASGALFVHIEASLQRVAAGFVLAVIAGVPLGLLMGYSYLAERLLTTTVNGLRPVPASAWIPLSIILMGIGERPAIFLVFIGTVWSIVLNAAHGVKNIPKHLIWAAQTMGASNRDIFVKVVFPAAMSSTFTGMRIAVGVAFTNVIVAELIAVRSGLGYLITEARMLVRPDIVIAGMIAIGVVGFTLDVIVRFAMNRALRWQRGLVAE